MTAHAPCYQADVLQNQTLVLYAGSYALQHLADLIQKPLQVEVRAVVSYNNGKDLHTKLRSRMLQSRVFLPRLSTGGSVRAGSSFREGESPGASRSRGADTLSEPWRSVQ